jgi:hypothetical protein
MTVKRMPFPKPADYPFWLRLALVIVLALFVVNAFFFIAPASAFLAWAFAKLDFTGKELVAAIGTLIASFAGAWFAFRFAQLQRQKERVVKEVAAGNQALFMLQEIWNTQLQYQREIVEPHRNRPDAWLNMSASHPFDDRGIAFDIEGLSFLLRGHASAFQQVQLEHRRFQLAALLVKDHRQLALSEVFPRLSAAGIGVGESQENKEIETILGPGIVRQLNVVTDSLTRNVDENVKSSMETFKSLRAALKAIHPKQKFIDVRPFDHPAPLTSEFQRSRSSYAGLTPKVFDQPPPGFGLVLGILDPN